MTVGYAISLPTSCVKQKGACK